MLIDSHVHLYDKKFARDYERVMARAEDAGIERLICVGDRVETSRRSIALAKREPRLAAAVGIHPHHDMLFTPQALMELEVLARDPKVVAIGEIGLDYHYPNFIAERQLACFRAQGHLAGRRGLPLIIHCRDAYDELVRVLQDDPRIQRRGVVHCFSGNLAQAQALIELGFYLGIGGAVTYPHGDVLRNVVTQVGLERLLVETDAPYLPPQSKRGRRNEPAYMKHTVKTLADLTGYTYQDAARITKSNTIRCFGLAAVAPVPAASYAIRQTLYLCLTNRCSNECYFCQRCSDYMVQGHFLKLDHEPTAAELLEHAGDTGSYREVVLSGLGEPTLRWDVVLETARGLKARGARVRLNTNGQGNLLNGRDLTPEMAGHFDSVAINLIAHDQATYNQIARPERPDEAFPALLAFAEACKQVVPDVVLTVVAVPEVDVEACRALAEDQLKVRFRIREYRPSVQAASCAAV